MKVATGIILLIGFCLAVVHMHPARKAMTTTTKGNVCECGSFKRNAIRNDKPIAVKIISAATCTKAGKKKCIDQCKLANNQITNDLCKNKSTEIVVQGVKPTIFGRVCNKGWIYTEMSSKMPICCKNSKRVQCF